MAETTAKGPKVVVKHRLYHTQGGSFTDFDSEKDLLDFVKDATKVSYVKEADGTQRPVFSPNQHLVHGAAHHDYPNLRVEQVRSVEFPEDDE